MSNHHSNGQLDIFLVVAALNDSTHDSDNKRIVFPLKATLRIAETKGTFVVFAQCYLPQEHPSIEHRRVS